MTPLPIDPTSQPEVLRQLKALLDQGAITAAEYAILKHRALTITADTPAPPKAPAAPTSVSAVPPSVRPAPVAASPAPAPPAAELPSLLDMFQPAPASPAAPTPAPAPVSGSSVAAPVAPAPPKLVPVAPIVVPSAPGGPPPPAAAPEPAFLPVIPAAPAVPVAVTPAVPAATTPPAAPEMRPLTDFLPPAAPVRPAATTPLAPAPPVPMTPAPAAPVLSPPVAAPRYPEPAPSEPAPVEPLRDFLGSRAVPPPAEPMATAAAPAPAPDFQPVPSSRRPSRALPKVLLGLFALALLGVLAYLFLGRDQRDEHLTSRSRTAADSAAVRPETGPQTGQLTLPPAPEPAVVPTPSPAVASVSPDSASRRPPVAAPAPRPAASTEDEGNTFPSTPTTTRPSTSASAPTPAPTPAPAAAVPADAPTSGSATPAADAEPAEPVGPATAPEEGDDEATTRVRQALSSYYADLQVPPFNAKQHFAPVVERLYTRQNLTPAAIEAELNQSMFPEFKQLNTTVVPGTLRVGPPAADGTRTATYIERSRAFRVSRGQHQRTRTQVRVRFDPDYKMTYLRQEKLLENTFEQ